MSQSPAVAAAGPEQSRRFPDAVVASVKANVSLLTLSPRYGLKPRKIGNDYKAICPFHKVDGHPEKTPSLNISPAKNEWHCFSCNEGGDVIRFVMLIDNLTFPQAVEKLLALTPVPVMSGNRKPAAKGEIQQTPSPQLTEDERQAVLRTVIERTTEALRNDRDARTYLERRCLDPLALLQNYTLGYWSPGLFKDLAPEEKKKLALLGLATNGSALFDQCIIFPLKSNGRITTIYGRNITTSSDALSGRHYLMPGKRAGLYLPTAGLNPRCPVIITESIIDGLSSFAAGFTNVLPLLGVNGYLPDHLAYLKSQCFPKIFIALDGDDAGRRAAAQLKQNLAYENLASEIIELPDQTDLNDMLRDTCAEHGRSNGPARLREWIAEKTGEAAKEENPTVWEDNEDLWILLATREYRTRGLSAQGHDRLSVNLMVRDVSARHNFYVDRLDLYQSRAREHFIGSVSKFLGAERDAIASDVNRLIVTLEEIRLKMKDENGAGKPYVMSDQERAEAMEYLTAPNLLARIAADFEACGMMGNADACVLSYLCGLSRLTDKPLGTLIVSRSGAGKSYMQDMVAAFTPEENLYQISRMTGQSLFYQGRNSLRYKLLSIEEDEGMKDGLYSVRVLLSSQRLKLQGVNKDAKGNGLTSFENIVEGPVSVMISTTNLADFDHETANRFFTLFLDESAHQTQKILEQQDRMGTLDGLKLRETRKRIEKLHRNIQRLLKPLSVVNPIGTGVHYPSEILNARREKTKAQSLLKTIALLHQYQRPLKQEQFYGATVDYIEVTQEDVDAVLRIAGDVLKQSIDELPKLCRELLAHIHAIVEERFTEWKKEDKELQRWQVSFTRKELMDRCKWSRWHLEEHLKELEEAGYIVQRMGKRGQRYSYSLVEDTVPEQPNLTCAI